MLSNLGNILIIFNIIITLFIIYFGFVHLKDGKKSVSKKIYKLSLYQTTLSITCFLTLVLAFIYSDFSLITVFQNSHSLKPLFYKIAGTWGNHEGSLLLWINVLVIFSYLFLIFDRSFNSKYLIFSL